MTGLEALQSVQYVTVNNARFAVINVADWEALIEWLETIEDVQGAKQAFAELKICGGNRQQAGWRRWSDVRGELELGLEASLRPRGRPPQSKIK